MPPTQVDDPGAGLGIEPCELALHLHRQFTRGSDDKRQRLGGGTETLCVIQKSGCECEAECDGLAGAGLRRNQQIATGRVGLKDGKLDGGRLRIVARGEGAGERRMGRRKCHGRLSFSKRMRQPAKAEVAVQREGLVQFAPLRQPDIGSRRALDGTYG